MPKNVKQCQKMSNNAKKANWFNIVNSILLFNVEINGKSSTQKSGGNIKIVNAYVRTNLTRVILIKRCS